jgi:pyroglutamyl-peptidase
MLTVLFTGFEPFGGSADNPSARAVLALAAAEPPAGTRIASEVLPVRYGHAGIALSDAVRRHRPDVLIATGLAGGRAEISVERVAINVDDARIPDNEGMQRIDTPVVAGGPAAYFSTLPIKAIAAAIRAAGVPAQVSQTAGTFLCNHVFYRACHLAATEAPGMRAGFLHLPWLPEQAAEHPGAPSVAFADVLTALRAAIAATRDTTQDLAVAAGAVS